MAVQWSREIKKSNIKNVPALFKKHCFALLRKVEIKKIVGHLDASPQVGIVTARSIVNTYITNPQ